MFPGGCGPATLEHFEKSKMAANYEKNCHLIGIKSILCCKNKSFLMIQIDVHFWNEYVPCQCKINQSKEPREMLLSSKI